MREGQLSDDRLDDADELVVEPVVGEQADGLVAAPHAASYWHVCSGPDATRADANPRWHQPKSAQPGEPRVSTGGSLRRDRACEKCHKFLTSEPPIFVRRSHIERQRGNVEPGADHRRTRR